MESDASYHIVEGNDAIENIAPYMISVQASVSGPKYFQHICGGSIVSENFVLSAAHCFHHELLDVMYQIVAGEYNFNVTSGREQIRQVLKSETIIHEHYDRYLPSNDIALLKLLTPLDFIEGIVGKINLPPAGHIPSGNVTLFGWGSVSEIKTEELPHILQTVVKDIIPNDICRKILEVKFSDPLSSTQICTGPLKSRITACYGNWFSLFRTMF